MRFGRNVGENERCAALIVRDVDAAFDRRELRTVGRERWFADRHELVGVLRHDRRSAGSRSANQTSSKENCERFHGRNLGVAERSRLRPRRSSARPC